MSEFLIVCGDKPKLDELPKIERVEMRHAEDVVARAARQLFSPADLGHCWYARDTQGCTDTFFTEAQAMLLDGLPLEKTRLYQVLHRALPMANQVALFYADDWQDLPVLTDEQDFFTRLQKNLECRDGGVVVDVQAPVEQRSKMPQQPAVVGPCIHHR